MGLGISMKSFIPFRQGQGEKGGVKGTVPQAAPFLAATQPVAPVANPLASLVQAASPLPAAALPASPVAAVVPAAPPSSGTATPAPDEKKKLEKDILNLFTQDEAIKSPIQNLAAGLPEVEISKLFEECREIRRWLA